MIKTPKKDVAIILGGACRLYRKRKIDQNGVKNIILNRAFLSEEFANRCVRDWSKYNWNTAVLAGEDHTFFEVK